MMIILPGKSILGVMDQRAISLPWPLHVLARAMPASLSSLK